MTDRYRRRLEGHVDQGRFDAALALIDLWQTKEPRRLEPELLRARVELLQGRYRAACDRFVAAVREFDCPPEQALDIANGLRVFVAHDALVDWASSYPHRAALKGQDQALVAATLSTVGAHALARAWADEAVLKESDDGICRVNRALILGYLGEFEAARADLQHVIGGPQESAMAYWLLARLDRQTPEGNHVSRLRECIARQAHDSRSRELLQFALFKELDDLGDVGGAWDALMAGCSLVRQRVAYDAAMQERLFAALKRGSAGPTAATSATPADPLPIFVVGMHRSGTTLVESMLASNPAVYAYGESQRFSAAMRYATDHYCQALVDESLALAERIDVDLVRRRFLREGRRLIGAARYVTEKMPGNFQLIGLIRRALPEARIVHVRRDPLDLCFANLRELFADGVAHAYGLEDLAHFHGLYRDMMQHWDQRFPGWILDVHYEELVQDPTAVSRRLFEFCGVDWDAGVVDPARWAARAINTLSSAQVRRTISRSSIGRWRPYARWLEPLQTALGVASPVAQQGGRIG